MDTNNEKHTIDMNDDKGMVYVGEVPDNMRDLPGLVRKIKFMGTNMDYCDEPVPHPLRSQRFNRSLPAAVPEARTEALDNLMR